MSASPSAYQSFQTDWQKTAAWAKSQGISSKQYLPIYQLDASRLLQYGTPMSQAERTRAVLAGAGMGLTQVPSDNPSPTNVMGNVLNNAEQIFTGLNPVSIVKNLFDTVTNTVEHPMGSLVNPLLDQIKASQPFDPSRQKDEQAFTTAALGNDSPLAFIPGAVDIAQINKGQQGFKNLATSPLTSILDVLPYAKLGGSALVKFGGEAADTVAAKAGVSTEELKGMSAGQIGWKLAKNAKAPGIIGGGKALGHLPATAEGVNLPKYADQTTGDLVNKLRNHFGAGADQRDLNGAIRTHEQVGTSEKIAVLHDFNQAWSKLDKQATLNLNHYLSSEYHVTDFRPDSEILADPKFSIEQRTALEQTFDMDRHITETSINAGELKAVNTAAGPELYLAGPGSRASAVEAASAKMAKANEDLHASAEEMNKLLDKTTDVDHIMMAYFDQLAKYRETVYGAIKDSLPDIAQGNKAWDSLTDALPKDKKPGVLKSGGRNIAQGNKKNLETFLGLEEKTESRVYRGGTQEAVPFSGPFSTWSDAERVAYHDSRTTLLKEADTDPSGRTVEPTASKVRDQAEKRLKITSQVHDVKIHAPIPSGTARILSELVGTGGLIDQAVEAFDNQDFAQLHAISKVAYDKIHNKSFQSPTRSDQLDRLNKMVDGFYQYSKTRHQVTEKINSLWEGKNAKGKLVKAGRGKYKDSVASKVADAEEASKQFYDVSVANPPAVWDTYRTLEYNRQLAEHEEGKRVVQEAINHLRTQGLSDTDLKTLEANPQVIIEMGGLSSIMSYENHMLPNVPTDVANEINKGINKQIFDLRQKGMKPLYLATLHPFDRIEGTGAELYNVTIGKTSISRQQSTFEKSYAPNAHGTIYNYQAGMNKAVHEAVVRDHEIQFQNEDMAQFLFNRSDLENIIRQHFVSEAAEKGVIPPVAGGPRSATWDKFVESKLDEWHLSSYDPTSIFSHGNPKLLGNDQFIDKDILKGLEQSFQKMGSSNKVIKGYDKATGIFRTSILGYSPRFTAHIMVGGTMLLAAKSTPAALLHIGDAWRLTKSFTRGEGIPEDLAAKFGLTHEDITTDKVFTHNSTQEGDADILLKSAMGHSAGQFAIQEKIAQMFGKDAADMKHPDFLTHYLKVIPEMNYKLTRFSTNMQRAVAFLDGLHHASKKDSFHIDEYDETLGKVVRKKYDMTAEQTMEQAMQHVDRTMGDVRNMTPIEYNVLTRVFPFWAWTNHVLHYVAQYPGDHPYRAMFLSQMSRISAQEQPAGLPLRSQLLFFLGNPDQSGNVSAVDMRAANPLRDTSSYLTLAGWLSAINPVITAPFSKVDPNITFGTNVLYPNISYSDLYGTSQADPSGTLLGTVEGVVPEVSALDQALNLSGQYAYLQGSSRNKFIKSVFDSLGVPWIPQQLNLRQIAATNELSRYKQAEAAAGNAWSSGDFSQLQGYGKVPDPRNTQYDISPQDLQSLYSQYASGIAAGLGPGGPSAVAAPLQSPAY